MDKNLNWARVMVLCCTLSFCNLSFADSANTVTEDPTAIAMAADLVVVRPLMLAVTAVGSVIWVLGLPFSAAGGNVAASADTLVIGPAKTTFVRCLGCTHAGYHKSRY